MQIEGMEVSLLTVTEVSGTISGIAKGKEIQVIFEVGSLGDRKRSAVGPKILSLIGGSFHCTVLCFLMQSCLTVCDPMVCSPLQYSCLENLMDRGAGWTTDHRVTNSQTGLHEEAQHSTVK